MTVHDIVIIVIIVLFAAWGWKRGIIRESFDAAGIIIGVLAARQFAPVLGAKFPPQAMPQLVRTIIASIIILILVWLGVKLLGGIVRGILRHGPLKSLDRLGGVLIGCLKGSLLVLALAILLAATPLCDFLDAFAGKRSPVYNTTMGLAKPLANRYRKALGYSIKKHKKLIVKDLPKTIPTKETIEELAVVNESSIPPDMSRLQVSLDTLSPETEQKIRQLLKDQKVMGFSLEKVFDKLKASGTTLDISLDDLSPEARKMAKSLIEDQSLTKDDIVKLADEAGIDPESIAKELAAQLK
ncbi:MAG: CvpA family protein [Candidatus Hatepunaea meridiana]|nr:CvpA family protein [Candidatus Hatepunaea meridiana]